MAVVNTDWEKLPSFYELARGIQEFLVKNYHETFAEPRKSSSVDSSWMYFTNFTSKDLLLIFLFSITWTILRHIATERVFKPLGHHYVLTPTDQQKMPESAFKFLYFVCSWSYGLYIVALNDRYKFFQKPSTVWDNWNMEESLPMDIYIFYMANCGFYIHFLYATLFVDTWRKDYLAMIIHHIATLLLLFISFSLRYHKIGCLVLFFHDACDIVMEFAKLNSYFRTQGGKYVKKHGILANISFLLFSITWVVARLTLFPLKVMYTSTTVVQEKQFDLKYPLFLNSLLWMLYVLNLYWFLLILQLLYRVATGQMKELDDTRDYDVEEKNKLRSKQYKNGKQNRNAKTIDSCDDSSFTNDDLTGKGKNPNKKME